jgi:hypothetical protein
VISDKKPAALNSDNEEVSRQFPKKHMLLRFLLVGLFAHEAIAGKNKEKNDKPKKWKGNNKGGKQPSEVI